MKYYVSRQGQQYGPYSREEVDRYLAQGTMVATDLARLEDSQAWTPLGQLLQGPNSPAIPPSAPQPSFPQGQAAYRPQAGPVPVPPSLHWALVLLIGMVTCGLFSMIWAFVQSSWVSKIDQNSKATLYYVLYVVLIVASVVFSLTGQFGHYPAMAVLAVLLELGACVLFILGAFDVKHSLELYYNTTERINLRLSGVMVFFFNILYIQHHLTRIADWKTTGVLRPSNLSSAQAR